MLPMKPFALVATLFLAAVAAASPALAWGSGGSGPHCRTVINNKWININKSININKNIDVWKSIVVNNDVNIEKNIWINKPITINKNISINKGSVNVQVEAGASAQAGAVAIAGGGGFVEETTVNKTDVIGSAHAEESCEMQEATVVKAIHAVCVAPDGREFPASHMLADTWIDSSYEGEVARCIPGAYVKVVIGEVVQSDQGMAGTYEHGESLVCAEHEALRHFKDGMLKCAPVVPVRDCTERTNLRRFGTGDLFFSYRSRVCATITREVRRRAIDVSGMSLEGGVGP